MFGDSTPEEIRELHSNTTSRMIISLIVKGIEADLSHWKVRRSDGDRMKWNYYSGQSKAYFDAAVLVEKECWGEDDMSRSFTKLIFDVAANNPLQETINILEGYVNKAKGYGF